MSSSLPARPWRDYGRDTRGSAAMEFAIWLAALTAPTLGAVDVGFYGFQTLQVHNAAQMAAQAAWATCSTSAQQPATAVCNAAGGAALNAAIQTGEQSTPLGSGVTMASGSEKFWCVNSSGSFVEPSGVTDGVIATKSGDVNTAGGDTAGSANSKTCTYGASSSATPGDYVVVTVQFNYRSPFKGMSVISFLNGGNATITQTAWTRIA